MYTQLLSSSIIGNIIKFGSAIIIMLICLAQFVIRRAKTGAYLPSRANFVFKRIRRPTYIPLQQQQPSHKIPTRTISSLSLSIRNECDSPKRDQILSSSEDDSSGFTGVRRTNSHEKLNILLPEEKMGTVSARILPKDFVEYPQRKAIACIDPKYLLSWYRVHTCTASVPAEVPQNSYACHVLGPSHYPDHCLDQNCYRKSNKREEWTVNIDATFDYIYDNNGIDNDEKYRKPMRKSTVTSTSYPQHIEAKTSLEHFELHMNRKALEPANRTLRRFEISTARKYQSDQAGHGKRSRKDLFENNQKSKAKSSSIPESVIMAPVGVFDSNGAYCSGESCSEEDSDASLDGYRSFNISNMTSAEAFEEVASLVENDPKTRKSAILNLSMPDGSAMPLELEACPPTILAVKTFENFESRLFVGVPLVIQTDVIHATRSVVTWFADGIPIAFDSPCFTPTDADIGKFLSVLIVPIREGHDGEDHEEAYRFKLPVEPLPFMPLVSPLRDEWTANRTEESLEGLRLVTYNILADLYTSREVDQQMMYNHCPPVHLHKNRRMPMLLYEILSYHADVVCLQEVDANIYLSLLEPVMESQGYQGYYSNKASSQLEGCAMFWSLKVFERAGTNDKKTFILRDLFGLSTNGTTNNDDTAGKENSNHLLAKQQQQHRSSTIHPTYAKWDSMDSIGHLLSEHDELRRVTREKTGQVLQIASLTLRKDLPRLSKSASMSKVKKPEKVAFGNTHLFYHPMADHVRAMQAYVVCKQLDYVRRNGWALEDSRQHHQQQQQQQHDPYPFVLCGDLNSNPMSGALHLLLQRRLGPDHFETWKHLHDYNWEMGDYEFMLEHGYVGNEEGDEPQYLEEEFVDALEYLDGDDDSDDDDENTFEDTHGNNDDNVKADQTIQKDDTQHGCTTSKFLPTPPQDGNVETICTTTRAKTKTTAITTTAVSPPPLVLPRFFPTLVSGYRDMPQFTNYAIDFTATLDYILASEPTSSSCEPFGFAPMTWAPMPTKEDIEKYVAMPNEFMPSDHVSMVCDLEWKYSPPSPMHSFGK